MRPVSEEHANARVVDTYSRWAFAYDAWTALFEKRSLHAALDVANIHDGEAILEVAVGTGVLFRELLRRNPGGRNVGVDLTEPMLRRARQKAGRTGARFELVRADASALPFADSSFDLVINNNMLGLLPEASFAPILAELFRVLRPGGRLVTVMMKRPPRGAADLLYQALPVWFGGWRDVDIRPSVVAAGFERIGVQVVTQLGIPSEVLVATKATGTAPVD